jgi:hypothetical protein
VFEDLKEEEIVNKVGGRFKLSTLIQKPGGLEYRRPNRLWNRGPRIACRSCFRKSWRTRSIWIHRVN